MSADPTGPATPGPEIFVVAGEASGDRHAAELLRELRKLYPTARFTGVGGRHLKAAGQEQLFDLAVHAVVGLTDVLWNYRKFRGFFRRLEEELVRRQPAALVLVDFPGFNLRLAAALRRRLPETKFIYFISPQVWAWKSARADDMARVLDHLLVIFSFEKEWFAKRRPDLPVTWVGHPIVDRWAVDETHLDEEEAAERIVLLPGSRRREIDQHLTILLGAVRIISARRPGVKFSVLASDPERRAQIEKVIRRERAESLGLDIRMGYQLTHLARSSLALVASGTATLECAAAGLPMIILYRVNPVTFWVGRKLVKLPYIGMVNVIAGEKVVPEFLQDLATPEGLAEASLALLDHPPTLEKMRERLAKVRKTLGEPGVNERAARAIRQVIEEPRKA
ncbi:MAG: lipid-A-disaccharide synthase [Candidatus Methylacidiphilales bacterium]|nr:lipid-A-disaccharide synthase [Candidatus Methylacidiphilales bacterium]